MTETIDKTIVRRAKKGEYNYYVTENGKLFYKKPKVSAKRKFGKILMKPLELENKLYHARFKKRLAQGKYNSSPIPFKKAETLEDAVKFGKTQGLYRRIKGLNPENQADLKLLNKINESLCTVHNRTGGRSIMPRKLYIKNTMKSSDGLTGIASYTATNDILTVSRTWDWKRFPKTIYHEMGHANHALNTDIRKMMRIEEIIARSGKNAKITSRFKADAELQELIFKNMREYSMSSPAEFVADIFALKIARDTKIHHKLEQAYEALNGPNIVLTA